MWPPGEGNGKPLHYSCLENSMNSMKRQKDRILKEECLKSVGAQYPTRDQWRNNSRNDEEMEPKQKQCPAVDVTGDEVKANSVKNNIVSLQFSSVAQSCPTPCDPMNRSMPGLPVITISQSSLRLTSIESVMPSSHLILSRPLQFSSIQSLNHV